MTTECNSAKCSILIMLLFMQFSIAHSKKIIPMNFFLFGEKTDLFQLLGPLEAVVGEDLTVICISTVGGASALTLRENGMELSDERIQDVGSNNTHITFVLTGTTIEEFSPVVFST